MIEQIRKELEQEQLSESMQKLVQQCVQNMKDARAEMEKRYSVWDQQHDIYRQQRVADKEDRRSYDQGKPVKMIVPLTFAQINTLVSFFKMLFMQNQRFFELSPVSMRDHVLREVAETLLQRDLDNSNWTSVLDQFLLDVCKYGLGVLQTSWVNETMDVVEATEAVTDAGGVYSPTKLVSVTTFQGTKVFNVSPYKFFPDHRWPTRDFQQGEYCAIVEEHSRDALADMEKRGEIAGLEYVRGMDKNTNADLMRLSFDLNDTNKTRGMCVVNVIQVKLVPSEIFLSDGSPLGPEKTRTLYTVWLANDNRIIKLEKVNAAHCRFTYEAGELYPDIHEKNNSGLAELINDLQELVGWFVNSRVSAVSKTIDNWLVADPKGVDMNSVEARSRVIMLKPGASAGGGIDRYIKQLTVQDTTTRHMDDASQLIQLMQTVTGVNENAMGQYNGGRRSATEARAVIQGASGRMRNLAVLLWNSVLGPLGRQLLLNHRQGLSQEQFVKLVGEENAAIYPEFHKPISQLIGSYDLFVFDATSPSEKTFLAQSLQELLTVVLTNPMVAAQFNLDPQKMIKEIYELRGIPGLTRFAFDPAQRQQLLAPVPPGAPGAPGEPSGQGTQPPVGGGAPQG